MRSCTEIKESLALSVDDRRTLSQVETDHLQGCSSCRSFYKRQQSLQEELGTVKRLDTPFRVEPNFPGRINHHEHRAILVSFILACTALILTSTHFPSELKHTFRLVHVGWLLSRNLSGFLWESSSTLAVVLGLLLLAVSCFLTRTLAARWARR